MPCEIWERIGTLLLPNDDIDDDWVYRHAMREVLTLSLASSNLNTTLAPTRRAAEQILLRIRRMSQVWLTVLDELLSDDPEVQSGHSAYFSVVCDYADRPLLYYTGPQGKYFTTARGMCQVLGRFAGGMSTAQIVEEMGYNDSLSIIVTTSREQLSEKVKAHQAKDVQSLSLSAASVRVIADTMIKEEHPWSAFSLAFKPMLMQTYHVYKRIHAQGI